MTRRCVICGGVESFDKDGNPNFHYPKSRKEARIWQQSLNAHNVTLEALQKYCCVCFEHIPDFVDQTEPHKQSCCKACSYPSISEKLTNLKPPVNVLLMTGASLPTYCGKACEEQDKSFSDAETDICVLESNLADCGISFPDIDEPEFTVMRTPMPKDCNDNGRSVMGLARLCARDPDDGDLTGEEEELYENICTEVLVLGPSQKDNSCLACDCARCMADVSEMPVCPPACRAKEAERGEFPPCGCECEKKTRRDLNRIIKKQAKRINELEQLLNRQSEMQDQIFTKVEELHQNISLRGTSTNIDLKKKQESKTNIDQTKTKDSKTNVDHKKKKDSKTGSNTTVTTSPKSSTSKSQTKITPTPPPKPIKTEKAEMPLLAKAPKMKVMPQTAAQSKVNVGKTVIPSQKGGIRKSTLSKIQAFIRRNPK